MSSLDGIEFNICWKNIFPIMHSVDVHEHRKERFFWISTVHFAFFDRWSSMDSTSWHALRKFERKIQTDFFFYDMTVPLDWKL